MLIDIILKKGRFYPIYLEQDKKTKELILKTSRRSIPLEEVEREIKSLQDQNDIPLLDSYLEFQKNRAEVMLFFLNHSPRKYFVCRKCSKDIREEKNWFCGKNLYEHYCEECGKGMGMNHPEKYLC
jgi:hypothetical protein